jgi:hypothetical protein
MFCRSQYDTVLRIKLSWKNYDSYNVSSTSTDELNIFQVSMGACRRIILMFKIIWFSNYREIYDKLI